MTIHIPPFWCGVAATLLAEIALSVILYAVSERKKKRKKTMARLH